MMKQEDQSEKKNGEERGEREERGVREEGEEREEETEERFLKDLYFFMKQRDTPIERIPHLGFKQIDLYVMYKTVKDLGGYHQVTAQQLWKKVYNILGGNPRSTSAATCTRRHYEKLLLPYEYHLAGYEDEIPITPPRKHKLSLSFEDQYLLAPKRALIRHAGPFSQATPHDFLTDGRLQYISMSRGVPHPSYLHPSPTSLPNLFSVPHSMPHIPNVSAPFHTQTPGSFLQPTSFETESLKQPLDFLRRLANEYKSSSGLSEPLNLSKKTGRMEVSSNAPSSFSPPSSKIRPKFLNEALPMCSTRNDQPGAAARAPKVEAPEQAVVNPMSMDETRAVNLTSYSTLKNDPSPTSPLPVQRPSYPSTFPVKQPEKSLHAPLAKAGSSDTPQPCPSQAPSRPAIDPFNGMEIQIPLSLLQNWIKEGLISSLVSNRQHPSGLSQEPKKTPSPESLGQRRASSETSEGLVSSLASPCQQPLGPVPQDSSKPSSSPDSLGWGRKSLESADVPADLSLKNHVRDSAKSSKQDCRSEPSPTAVNESQPPTINRYASAKPFIVPSSPKMPFSRDPYHRISLIKAQAEEHDTSLKQANSRINNNTGPRSPGLIPYSSYGTPSFAGRLGIASEKAPMFKLNSVPSPLVQLTPEHLKLLLAGAPFRQERGKIC